MKAYLIEFFDRELLKLKEEISLYAQEQDLWVVSSGISNSAGNLVLHLMGNLNHFIGATLGNTGYVRQRDLEFSNKDVPRAELLERLDETRQVVSTTLQDFDPASFEHPFPLEKHGQVVSNGYMLLHLLTHLNYHLGQVNYHRRLIGG
ncbi:MAG: DinB family protein [Saprospiraceae bacterium]|nr:DinB family protein [Saprospiraceae bacterium]